MRDTDIIELFFARDESAIAEVRKKYGGYCHSVAMNILGAHEDAEECVNDTYLAAWNAIPPERPQNFSAYLGKITRNFAVGRYRHAHAGKRGEHETALVLDELSECVGEESVEQTLDMQAISAEISAFLRELPKEKRIIFVSRYWYAKSVGEIASGLGISQASVSMTLSRLRKKLGERLSERGFSI